MIVFFGALLGGLIIIGWGLLWTNIGGWLDDRYDSVALYILAAFGGGVLIPFAAFIAWVVSVSPN